MGKRDEFKFTVSILSTNARFSITEQPNWRNKAGFVLGLDEGRPGSKFVSLKYCFKIVDGPGNDKCGEKVYKVSKIYKF